MNKIVLRSCIVSVGWKSPNYITRTHRELHCFQSKKQAFSTTFYFPLLNQFYIHTANAPFTPLVSTNSTNYPCFVFIKATLASSHQSTLDKRQWIQFLIIIPRNFPTTKVKLTGLQLLYLSLHLWKQSRWHHLGNFQTRISGHTLWRNGQVGQACQKNVWWQNAKATTLWRADWGQSVMCWTERKIQRLS